MSSPAEIERWQPDVVAIEEVFYSVNAKSALKLGQVRGVALLAAARLGLPVAEYAPLKIKSSVVGYGLAKKEQVQFMVARLLNLAELPQPADAADALAIAICHIHTAQTLAVAEPAQTPVRSSAMRTRGSLLPVSALLPCFWPRWLRGQRPEWLPARQSSWSTSPIPAGPHRTGC